MKNIDKFIKELENMSKEDLVRAVKLYYPNLETSTLWKMDLFALATMVACSMVLEEIDKLKEEQRKRVRYYRSELNSEQSEIEREILQKLMDLTIQYQNLFDDAMQEYFKAKDEEEKDNDKRVREILEKHRKRMTDELNKKIRKDREEREIELDRQRKAQRKGIQCDDNGVELS